MGKARLLVSPKLLCKLLELPDDVIIEGASIRFMGFNGPTLTFDIEGDSVPDVDGGDIMAEYSNKPKFDGFRIV